MLLVLCLIGIFPVLDFQEYVYNRLQFRYAILNISVVKLIFVCSVFFSFYFNRLNFSYGWYFTFVQGFVYLLLVYSQGFTTKQMVNPWKTYVKLSAVLMGSHGLTKGSLAFLNYPAQIMFKSTKVNTWGKKCKFDYLYF